MGNPILDKYGLDETAYQVQSQSATDSFPTHPVLQKYGLDPSQYRAPATPDNGYVPSGDVGQQVSDLRKKLASREPDSPFVTKLKNYASVGLEGAKKIFSLGAHAPQQPFEAAEKKFSEVSPDVLNEESAPTRAAFGVARGVNDLARGLTSPENLALMVGSSMLPGKTLARVASGAFSAQMAKEIPGLLSKYREAYGRGDVGEAARIGTAMIGTGIFSALGARHAMDGTVTPGPIEREATPTETNYFTEQALKEHASDLRPGLPAPGQATGATPLGGPAPQPQPAPEPVSSIDPDARMTLERMTGKQFAQIEPGLKRGVTLNTLRENAGVTDRPGLPAPGQASGATPLGDPNAVYPAPVEPKSFGDRVRERELSFPSDVRDTIKKMTGKNIVDFGDQVALDDIRRASEAQASGEPKTEAKPAPEVKQTGGIVSFIRGRGGINPKLPNSSDIREFERFDLMNTRGGKSLDGMTESAIESGWLPDGSTPSDLLDMIDSEIKSGKRAVNVQDNTDFNPEEYDRQHQEHLEKKRESALPEQEQGTLPGTPGREMPAKGLEPKKAQVESRNLLEDFTPEPDQPEMKWTSEAGAVINPADAMMRLADIASKSKTYLEFREAIARDRDLTDTARFYKLNLQSVYDKKDDSRVAVAEPPPAQHPPRPTAEAPSGKTRRFIETVQESPRTAPEVKEGVKGTYEPISNQATLEMAQEIIGKDPEKASRMAKGNQPATALSNAVGTLLIDKAQKEGRFEDAIDIVETMAKKATTQGQAIQALSIYNRLSPEGILRFAQRVIDQANTARPDLNLKLTPDVAREFVSAAEQIKNLPEGKPKIMATAKLLGRIREQVPPTFWQKVAAIQTMGQLLNPKTIIRNLGGNAGFAALENVSDVVGTGIDTAVGLVTGKRTKTLPSLSTQARGFAQGAKEGTADALTHVDTGPNATQFDLPKGRVFKDGFLGKAETGLNLALRAPDRAAYQAAYDESMRNQMEAAGAKEPTEAMKETANHDALYKTFQDTNAISRVFVGIKKALNHIGNKDFGLGDFVVKYPKTPANILARGIDYSPAGFVKVAFELSKPLFGKPFDQKAFVESTSRAMVGSTALVGTGAILHRLGIITGKREKDNDIANVQHETGLGEYRINTSALKRFITSGFSPDAARIQEGDTLVSYDWFQPAAIGLSIGANIDENKGIKPGSALGSIASSIGQGAQTLADQPLVQGIKKAAGSGSIVAGMGEIAKGAPASFAPTLINQVRMLFDNTSREVKDSNPFKEAANLVQTKVPGLANKLPPKVGPFGENREIFQKGTNSILNVFLNPAFVSKYAPTPEAQMVLDIYKNTGLTSQAPKTVGDTEVVNGMKQQLTAKQREELQRFIGRKTKTEFNRLAENRYFMSLPDEEKAKKLGTLITNIGLLAKEQILGDRPRSFGDFKRRALSSQAGRYSYPTAADEHRRAREYLNKIRMGQLPGAK